MHPGRELGICVGAVLALVAHGNMDVGHVHSSTEIVCFPVAIKESYS